ncbi:hypothetical protein LTS18_006946 [Coniosporium uncinatum]|uniref:Uncharacterized protein n=1 Tax=Coniosporium uncinatum TaxID=93489 RepID=A0ACC3DPJ5_9PEZI|nr:hypothetical protein LTS18_006946 [Coniosporium uncinatum]
MDEIELLIHISAPTTRKDDEKYRVQALAYDEFEANSVIGMADEYVLKHTEDAAVAGMPEQSRLQQPNLLPCSEPDSQPVSAEDAVVLDISFNGVPTSTRSPLSLLDGMQRKWKRQRVSEISGPSGIDGNPLLSSPAVAFEGVEYLEDTQQAAAALESQLYPSTFGLARASQQSSSEPISRQLIVEAHVTEWNTRVSGSIAKARCHIPDEPPRTPERIPTSQADSLNSVLPSDYALSQTTSTQSQRHRTSTALIRSQRAGVEQACFPENGAAIEEAFGGMPDQAHVELPFASVQKLHTPAPRLVEEVVREAGPISDVPLSASSPLPETGVEKLTDNPSYLTPVLNMLMDKMSMKYKPSTVARPLRPTERGYWSFSTVSWTSELQQEFWQILTKSFQNGACGWGISAHRYPIDDLSLGQVRVYCWGEIVPHIYLALYAYSNNQIRKVAPQWMDAEGKVVVQMPKALNSK